MAYQNVGRPRFIVDYINWYRSMGLMGAGNHRVWNAQQYDPANQENANVVNSLIGLNPAHNFTFNGVIDPNAATGFNYNVRIDSNFPTHDCNIVGLLGHNMGTTGGGIVFTHHDGTNYPYAKLNDAFKVNCWTDGTYLSMGKDGFSFCSYDGMSMGTNVATQLVPNVRAVPNISTTYPTFKLPSLLWGRYYDMNAPNLSLTMSREYGGTKEFTTYNGSSMSNTFWNKPPSWGDLGAWELGDGNPALAKSGRRTWDLKFSYMDDSDLWGSNQMLSYAGVDITTGLGYESGDINNSTNFNYNLLTDDNFFSQVWNKTLGMTLPCIFQPDSSNSNPDQFAIVKGVPNSLKATRSSFNTYDISLSIEEVW